MPDTYKIESVMKTGKGSPQFGDEFYVKFYESEGTFPLWFKSVPTKDQEIHGDINGNKFTKEKKEWPPKDQTPSSAASSPTAPYVKTSHKDNSDGMRQGMCMNNAANYISSASDPIQTPLGADEWAREVHKYASELYKLGDLSGN